MQTPASFSSSSRRFALIGCGRIAMPIVQAWREGALPGWTLSGVLARGVHDLDGLFCTSDADAFFSAHYDLIVETAGPAALAEHGVKALTAADVWSVSAAALADERLLAALQEAGEKAGHRLRLVSGAIAGLDGVAMASVDPDVQLRIDLDLPPGPGPRTVVFCGTVREAAQRFPDSVNVAVAAALGGPGLDLTQIVLSHPGPVQRHRLALAADSRYGMVKAAVEPRLGRGIHPVAACLIANLRRELQAVWVG